MFADEELDLLLDAPEMETEKDTSQIKDVNINKWVSYYHFMTLRLLPVFILSDICLAVNFCEKLNSLVFST